MKPLQRKPTSPGEILFHEFLEPLGISQKELADHLDVDYKVINRMINEKTKLTPEMALKLAQAFETTPQFWLNSQIHLDLWTTSKKQRNIPSLIRRKRKRIKA